MAKKREGSVIIYGPMQANTAKQTIGYTDGINHEYNDETKGNKQLDLIIEDYEKRISTIESSGGGEGSITIDAELSETSTNAVQNKVITKETNSIKTTYVKKTEITAITEAEILALINGTNNN